MKSTILIYIISIAFLMLSCDDRNTATLAPEYLYDAGDQKVIKSIINNKKGTIAMLYGNDLALQSAFDSLSKTKHWRTLYIGNLETKTNAAMVRHQYEWRNLFHRAFKSCAEK